MMVDYDWLDGADFRWWFYKGRKASGGQYSLCSQLLTLKR